METAPMHGKVTAPNLRLRLLQRSFPHSEDPLEAGYELFDSRSKELLPSQGGVYLPVVIDGPAA